jgi:hypothetical protein
VLPTPEARQVFRAKVGAVAIGERGRWNIDGDYRWQEAVEQQAPGAPADTRRTALPQTERAMLSGSLARGDAARSITLGGRLRNEEIRDLYGRSASLSQPLKRQVQRLEGRSSVTAGGAWTAWRWSAIGQYDVADEDIRTRPAMPGGGDGAAVLGPFGQDRSLSTKDALADLLVSGSPLAAPAGAVNLAVQASLARARRDLDAQPAIVAGLPVEHRRAKLRTSLDIPVAGGRERVLTPLGDISLNLNGEVGRTTGFGEVSGWGYGLRWSPIGRVSVIASAGRQDIAPDLEQLALAPLATPNARIYDFRRAVGVETQRIDAGTPALGAARRDLVNLRVQVRPVSSLDLSLSADYTDARTDNAISAPTAPTPQIEAAFPQLVHRDAGGAITAFEARPVNFARQDSRQLRVGINFYRAFGHAGPTSRTAREEEAVPTEEEDSDEEGSAASPHPDGGHLLLAIYHTWRFEDSVRLRPGLAPVDLLDGAAVTFGGGTPSRQLEVLLSAERSALAGRLGVTWSSSTTVRGFDDIGRPTALTYSADPRVNLRLILDLRKIGLRDEAPWLRGKLNVSIDNLFDSHSQVRDLSGQTPFGFDQDNIDPVGRSFRITLRKQFKSF